MNKAQLVQAVADRTGSSPTEARRHVDAVFEEIVSGVSDGERVSILGFGTFDSAARAARTARNPRTGATIDVPAATVPRFRIGAGFKARVSGTAGPTSSKAAPSKTASSKTATGTKVAPATAPKPAKKDAKKDAKKTVDEPAKKPKKSEAKASGKAADTRSKGSRSKDSGSKKGKKSKKKKK